MKREIESMTSPFLDSKIQIPPQDRVPLERKELLRNLDQAWKRGERLFLTTAWGGSGKTQLLSQWVRSREIPFGWINLDERDQSPQYFLSYLIYAIQQQIPGFAADLLGELQGSGTEQIRMAVDLILAELQSWKGELLLVFDDYHLAENPQLDALLIPFLSYLPENIAVVLSSRSEPAFPWRRWQTQGRAFIFNYENLGFTRQESARYLKSRLSIELESHDLDTLHERLQGWAVGIQLVGFQLSSMDQGQWSSFICNISGTHHYLREYILESTLSSLSKEERYFFQRVSILNELDPELCKKLSGRGDSLDILQKFYRKSGFLLANNPLEGSFRLHHLMGDFFRESLKSQVSAQEYEELLRITARWLERKERLDEALSCYIQMENSSALADFLERQILALFYGNQMQFLKKCFLILSREELLERPLLMAVHGGYLFLNLDYRENSSEEFREVEYWISRSRQKLKEPNHPGDYKNLQAKLFIEKLELYLMLRQGTSPDRVIPAAREYLFAIPDQEPWFRSAIHHLLGLCFFEKEDHSQARCQFQRAVDRGIHQGDLLNIASSYDYLSAIHLLNSQIEEAKSCCHRGIELALHGGQPIPYSGLLHQRLGRILCEEGDFVQARTSFQRGMSLSDLGDRWQPPGPASLYLIGLDYLEANGDVKPQGEDLPMDNLEAMAPEDAFLCTYLAILLKVYSHERISQLNFEHSEAPGQEGNPWESLEILTWKVHLGKGQLESKEITWLEQNLKANERSIKFRLYSHILLIHHYLQRKDWNRANGLFLEMEMVSSGHYIFTRLLGDRDYLDWIKSLDTGVNQGSLGKMQALLGNLQNPSKRSDMTPRELEILAMICSDKSNREIEEELFISQSTVKTHINRIYGKLQVKNRSQAILRAIKEGLVQINP